MIKETDGDSYEKLRSLNQDLTFKYAEKFFEKKKNRREFLNKAGIGGAGLALGLSGASAFFAPKLTSQEKISYGNENQDKED